MTSKILRTRQLAVLLLFLFCQAVGCSPAGTRDPGDSRCECEVIFSLANTDRSSPHVKVDVQLDHRTVIYGGLPQVTSGDYFYVSTCLPRRHATLVVRMETEGEALEESRKIKIENKMWIVITRVRDLGDGATMKIDVSYEQPAWSAAL